MGWPVRTLAEQFQPAAEAEDGTTTQPAMAKAITDSVWSGRTSIAGV